MRIIDTILLKIGCYWGYILIISLLLFILLFSHFNVLATQLFIYLFLLTLISFVYYQHFAIDRLDNFVGMLKKKYEKEHQNERYEAFVLLKRGERCTRIQVTRKSYDVSVLFLKEDFLTFFTHCPKFHLFRFERHGAHHKWTIKTSCYDNKEFYYPYIQSAHFDHENKELHIVLTSGEVEKIKSDKKYVEKAISALRVKLRDSDRGIQTNRKIDV